MHSALLQRLGYRVRPLAWRGRCRPNRATVTPRCGSRSFHSCLAPAVPLVSFRSVLSERRQAAGAFGWQVMRVRCARTPSHISVLDPLASDIGDMMVDSGACVMRCGHSVYEGRLAIDHRRQLPHARPPRRHQRAAPRDHRWGILVITSGEFRRSLTRSGLCAQRQRASRSRRARDRRRSALSAARS